MLTEEEKDILREEKDWAKENIIFTQKKLSHVVDEKNYLASRDRYWRIRFERADRKLAFEEKLLKVENEKDILIAYDHGIIHPPVGSGTVLPRNNNFCRGFGKPKIYI